MGTGRTHGRCLGEYNDYFLLCICSNASLHGLAGCIRLDVLFLSGSVLDALGFRLNNDMDMLAFLGIGLGVGAYLLGLAWSIGTAVNRIK